MAFINETEQWESGVYQLETTDPVQGGSDGVDNRPHTELANRTLWLKSQIESIVNELYSKANKDGDPDQRFLVGSAVNDNDALRKGQLMDELAVIFSRFTESITMAPGSYIFLEDGRHAISNNDGGGNFNIRVGCTPEATSKITERGYAGHLVFDQVLGRWLLKTSSSVQEVGDVFLSENILDVSMIDLLYRGLHVWYGDKADSLKEPIGYQKLPSGIIMQWGYTSGVTDAIADVLFPIVFPNMCFVVANGEGIDETDDTAEHNSSWTARRSSQSGFSIDRYNITDGPWTYKWFAIGV